MTYRMRADHDMTTPLPRDIADAVRRFGEDATDDLEELREQLEDARRGLERYRLALREMSGVLARVRLEVSSIVRD